MDFSSNDLGPKAGAELKDLIGKWTKEKSSKASHTPAPFRAPCVFQDTALVLVPEWLVACNSSTAPCPFLFAVLRSLHLISPASLNLAHPPASTSVHSDIPILNDNAQVTSPTGTLHTLNMSNNGLAVDGIVSICKVRRLMLLARLPPPIERGCFCLPAAVWNVCQPGSVRRLVTLRCACTHVSVAESALRCSGCPPVLTLRVFPCTSHGRR